MQFLRNLLGLDERFTDQAKEEPLSPEPAVRENQLKLKVGWNTNTGSVRRSNEDAVLVFTASHDGDEMLPPFGLFILADGMGGHQSGEVASSLAARTVGNYVIQHFYLPILISQDRDTAQPALNELLVNAFQAANRALAKQVPGGGTTLTCALAFGSRVYIAHVGDSRAYTIAKDGTLTQITQDHSLVDRLIELGQLSPAEALNHPQKNVLYRAVGQEGILEVDTYTQAIPEEGRLLLCSDGLWGLVNEEKIVTIIMEAADPQEACDQLVAAANRAGGRDNITAILLEPPLG